MTGSDVHFAGSAGSEEKTGFEGAEKRLELDFWPSSRNSRGAERPSSASDGPARQPLAPPEAQSYRCPALWRAAGLRSLSRAQLDDICTEAKCTIVSERHAPAFDAYVLSESSLFVYATKLVIKTCGTTALLTAAPRMLELASSVGLIARRVRYTRACFKYPKLQVCAVLSGWPFHSALGRDPRFQFESKDCEHGPRDDPGTLQLSQGRVEFAVYAF